MTKIEYPVRINKYLAQKNICSRREADKFISEGRVTINGRPAVLGDKVNFEDKVVMNKKAMPSKVYLAFNKPIGIVTHGPQKGEQDIKAVLNYPKHVFPVGRLDKDSWGLILLTNDGRVTKKLLDPEENHEKEYVVEVNKPVKALFMRQMEMGVRLDDGYKTKPCKIRKIDNTHFAIILTEGKKRQIRRMCASLNHHVEDLKRVRVANVKLGKLEVGEYRKIQSQELKNFLETLEIQ